jgi:hypothetical protein
MPHMASTEGKRTQYNMGASFDTVSIILKLMPTLIRIFVSSRHCGTEGCMNKIGGGEIEAEEDQI